MVHAGFAYSLAGMVARVASGVPTRPDAEIHVSMDMQVSSVIASNRELLVKRAVEGDATHLMFLDDDMTFSPQIIDILLGRCQPVVACNYVIKKFPLEFVAVGLDGRRVATTKDSVGIQSINYTGFGVSLFETRVFKAIEPPWFQMQYVPAAGHYTTEDLPCYEKIRAAGFPVYLDHDASKLVQHMGPLAYSWEQWKPPEVKPNGSN